MGQRPTTLVIGVGNPLRADDGVGPFVAGAVAAWQAPGVRALAVHQLLPEHAAELSGVGRLIVVDAWVTEQPDAAVRVERVAPAGPGADLSHRLDVGGLLALARVLGGTEPETWVVAVPVTDLGAGEALSAAARNNAAAALRLIAARLFPGHD
jgi:hydrogenase maturation protease